MAHLWAIADTHLGFSVDKPMDIFGAGWENHAERLAENWQRLVGPEDTILILGDISWGIDLPEATLDLKFLHELPGQAKILLRGNHDYWWGTKTKTNKFLAEQGFTSINLFQNEARVLTGFAKPVAIAGTRGWLLPTDSEFKQSDEKVYRREVTRLQNSLRQLADLLSTATQEQELLKIAIMHYPPLNRQGEDSAFSELLEEYQIERAYYGHVHGKAGQESFRGQRNGVSYFNVALDQVACTPQLII